LRVEAIKYHGKLEVFELPAQEVKHGHVLAKTLYVFLSALEKVLMSGWEPVVKPVVPGSAGVVRVLEDPSGRFSELSGRVFTVSPLGAGGVLGLDADGLLSTYQSLHVSYLYTPVSEPKPYHSLQPYTAYSLSLGMRVHGTTLIVGCEFPEIALATYLSEYRGEEPVLLCSNPPRYARIPVKVHKNIGDLDKQYASIVIGCAPPSLIHDLLREVRTENIVVSAFSRLKTLPLTPGITARVKYVDRISAEVEQEVVEELSKKLAHIIRVARVNSIEQAIGFLPPRGMGVVLEIGD